MQLKIVNLLNRVRDRQQQKPVVCIESNMYIITAHCYIATTITADIRCMASFCYFCQNLYLKDKKKQTDVIGTTLIIIEEEEHSVFLFQ